EKDIALAVGLRVEEILKRHGVQVKMSRRTDVGKSLRARTDEANAWGADCYVSLHCNAAASASAQGFEVWHTVFVNQSKGDELARAIVKYLDQLTPLANRGTKTKLGSSGRDYLHVIRETRMPAVLVEMGFVSNAKDAAYMRSAEGQAAIAEAIARGILEWGGIPYKGEAPKPAAVQTPAAQDTARYRLKTGTFSNAEALAAARRLVAEKFGWQTYEWAEGEYRGNGIWSPKYRLFTGTFPKDAAEAAAEQLRKATGWTVYVVEA
ncbi:MAG TPA: N-acetylmuramoyl-L-alanine amidase, partial [Calditerricola sp.]